MRILLGHLGSNGDCLYATAVAKQIKQDYPGCHLTWAVSSLARSVLRNNADIDAVWEIKLGSWADMVACWYSFEREAMRLHGSGFFDRVFPTQISPARFENYDGTIRPSIFRNFGCSVAAPTEITVNLADEDLATVDLWTRANIPDGAWPVILFECSSKSGQSFVTPAWAVSVAERVLANYPRACIILSTAERVLSANPRIVSAGGLTMLQNARLTHSADLFIGCGSGLTVVTTSDAAKRTLPSIQVLRRETSVYASMRHDLRHFGRSSDHILEITNQDDAHLAAVIALVLDGGFSEAKLRYDDPVPLTFDWYLTLLRDNVVAHGAYADAAQSLLITAERYSIVSQLRDFARREVLPFIRYDYRSLSPDRRERMERFRALYDT